MDLPTGVGFPEGYVGMPVRVIGPHRHGDRGVIAAIGATTSHVAYAINFEGELAWFADDELERDESARVALVNP